MTQEVKCPFCGSPNTTFIPTFNQMVCVDCKKPFSNEAEPRHLGDKALEPKHIFFSYGHDDNRELVDRFKTDLEKRGHTVWIDYKEIGTWDDWKGQITRGIIDSNLAIAFLSKHSTRDPGVCRNEIAMAMHHFGTVYPVLVEPLSQVDVPVTITSLQWPDLSQWRDIRDGKQAGIDFSRWYEEKLIDIINKIEGECTRFAAETKVLRDVLRPSSFDSKIAQHVEGFVGREWVFEAFNDWLDNKPNSRIFWLKAGPGFGKTALAVNLGNRNRAAIVGNWFCDHQSLELKDPKRALSTLAFQLAIRWDDYRTRLLPRLGIYAGSQAEQLKEARDELEKKSVPDLFRHLIAEPLAGLIWREHKLVILIDALDEATDGQDHNFLTDLVSQQFLGLPSWISFVVTSRPEASVVNRLQGFKSFDLTGSDERNLADLRTYCEHSLFKRPEITGLTQEERERLQERLIAKSEGMVLYLKLIEEGLKEGTLTIDGIEKLEAGLPGLYRRYYDSFGSRLSQDYEAKIKPLLRLILAAPGPLPAELVRQVLGWDKEVFNSCRNQLGSYLVDTSDGLQLFHKTLGEWLGEPVSGAFIIDPELGRKQLVSYLWNDFQATATGELEPNWPKQLKAWLPNLLPGMPEWNEHEGLAKFGQYLAKQDYQYSASARSILQRVVDLCEKTLGPEHPDVANALNKLVLLLQYNGNYADAEPLCRRALEINEKVLGLEHPAVATSLNNLAALLQDQGKYADAEPLMRRVLEIREKTLVPDHPDLAAALNNLAQCIYHRGHYAIAEPLIRRALEINEKTLGPEHPAVANSLNTLAALLGAKGDFPGAVLLLQRGLAINEKVLGLEHPDVATILNNLAGLLRVQGNYADAEPLYRRAQAIFEKFLGPEHPAVATSLGNLAELLQAQGNYADAEPLRRRELAIQEKALGPEHPDVATSLGNLAELLQAQGKYADAESLYRRALDIQEKALGYEHKDVEISLNNLAKFLDGQSNYADAEKLYRRVLAIREKALGPEHPLVIIIIFHLANLLKAKGDLAGAEQLCRRVLVALEKEVGPEHPNLVPNINSLAEVLKAQGDSAGAETLYRRALEIGEKALDPEHPYMLASLNSLADLLYEKGDNAGAETLYRRVLAIREKTLGPEDPAVVINLNDLAILLQSKGDYAGAEPLYRRVLTFFENTVGPKHPNLVPTICNLAEVLKAQGNSAGAEMQYRRALEIGEKALDP